jgi:hypothetical protein
MLVNPVRWIRDRMGHPLETFIELEVRDASGKLLTFRKTKAKSLLPQFLGLIKGQFALTYTVPSGVGNSTVVDTSGAVRNYPYSVSSGTTYIYWTGMQTNSGAGDSSYGLVVGTSDAPNAVNQYAMGAIIPHGNGTGQLYYGSHSYENVTNVTGTNDWVIRIIRTFSNNSGASITVKEIGLIVLTYDSVANGRYFLIARDVISPVTVPPGSTLTVRYIFKITVS